MERGNALLLTIITQHFYAFVSIFFRHRGSLNLRVHILNNISPLVFRMNRFFTQGTGHLTRLIEGDAASAVESMAARKELNGISGFMEGFQTDRTVYAARVIQTDMGIYTIHINTDITLIAVNMIVRTTHSTDATLLTVILTLVLII